MRLFVSGFVVASLLACSGVNRAGAQQPQGGGRAEVPLIAIGGSEDFDPAQPIKPGFQLSIAVTSAGGVPEQDLTGVFPVDTTGSVQLKLVGLVQLRGLTPTQAADKIAVQLRPYLREPKVTVTIVSVPKPVVFLSGAVSRPGAIPVNDNTTLAELLTIVGFTDNADLSRVRITRRADKENRTITEYNFIRWLKPGPNEAADEANNPVLADKDFIFVPLKVLPGTGSITVEGDVLRPGIVPMRQGNTLLLREALSLAGGPSPTADRRQVSIRRAGAERPIVVDYDKMEANDPAHNIPVQTDDIVYVQRLGTDQYINLNGAFVRPGKLAYVKPITLTQAIAEAGGFAPTAKLKKGRVFRHVGGADPTKTQIFAFDYIKIRDNRQPDILLEPGDTVEVQIGDVPRPPLEPLQAAQSLLSIALILDRLLSGRSNRGF